MDAFAADSMSVIAASFTSSSAFRASSPCSAMGKGRGAHITMASGVPAAVGSDCTHVSIGVNRCKLHVSSAHLPYCCTLHSNMSVSRCTRTGECTLGCRRT